MGACSGGQGVGGYGRVLGGKDVAPCSIQMTEILESERGSLT